MVRTPGFDKNGMKKGAWSPEEDDKLRSYIQRYGHWNWRELPKYAGLSRCGKSCRLRWLNYLRPNVKRGNYSEEEVNIIMELHEKQGNKWSAIAAKLPGRTDNEIKNYWHTHLSKRRKREQATSQLPKDAAVKTSQPQCNPNDQCTGVSQFEANSRNTTELSPENVGVAVAPPDHPILESSRTSPKTRGSEILCDSSPEDNATSLSESLTEPVWNFWTEPFLADTTCDQDQYLGCQDQHLGFMSPYGSQYDDDIDLTYQKLLDFPNY